MLRTIGIIIIVLLIVSIYYVYSIKKSFKVRFELNNVQLKDFNFQSLNSGSSFIQTRVKFFVLYLAPFNITFYNLFLEAYYNNVLIGKSSDVAENFKKITIIPNIENVVYQTFDLKINSSAIDLIYKIKTGQKYSIDYKLRANVFGIPVSFNDTYTN